MTRRIAPAAIAALLVAVAPLTAACGSDDPAPSRLTVGDLPQATSSIEYTYAGPAVPPPGHHEYLVRTAGSRATAIVGGYGVAKGDAPADATTTSTDVSSVQWGQLVEGLSALDDLPPAPTGCVGGSTYGVHVLADGRAVLDRSDVACGPTAAEVSAAYHAALAPISDRLGLPAS
ncbi:hypothetical protein [Gordonia neofelifaecis]|uniref:Lipoprotein n=1 Tax=Gordonia neofelifaecis NRRL B-59395 TaxID=644548 RepID=F1YNY2_9ACTN|nr:hypothetical protein [Gordonia neofelifaecis]EGD53601.1 hypothetical protein SCNU_18157 [Gordonia neofelifaecis NRRL B-59395]